MPELKKFEQLENLCYMEEVLKFGYSNISRNFAKGEEDPEYWWLIKENYNNMKLHWQKGEL